MTDDVQDTGGAQDEETLSEQELDDVAGGYATIFRKKKRWPASGCSCGSACTHQNVESSDGSAALSGEA